MYNCLEHNVACCLNQWKHFSSLMHSLSFSWTIIIAHNLLRNVSTDTKSKTVCAPSASCQIFHMNILFLYQILS